MDPSEVPSGAQGGVRFTTISVNPEVYLPWLKAELRARGVSFIRKRVQSLNEAAAFAGANGILVNATALGKPHCVCAICIMRLTRVLGARSLIGVEDTNVFPIRGQVIIVDAPGVKEFVSFPLGMAQHHAPYTH